MDMSVQILKLNKETLNVVCSIKFNDEVKETHSGLWMNRHYGTIQKKYKVSGYEYEYETVKN